MRISGIYKIQSKCKPDRCYIGSTMDIKRRWKVHKKLLECNSHHSKKLQRHFNKYGETDLQYIILMGCEKNDLQETEQYFIDSYNPYFNCCPNAYNVKGREVTEETRRKMSNSKIGNNNAKGAIRTDEWKEKQIKWITGHKVPDEFREMMSRVHKGKIISEESKHKMRIAALKEGRKPPLQKGTHWTEEQKNKIRGRKLTEEQKNKLKGREPWNKGLKDPYSEDTLVKMRKSGKKAWVIKKQNKAA